MTEYNPLTGMEMSDEMLRRRDTLRIVRRNARKDARSGNPAKRLPAQRVLRRLPSVHRHLYMTGEIV